jgi:hypothetical protein
MCQGVVTGFVAVGQGPRALEVFDPARHTVIGTVQVGQRPHRIGVSADGCAAFVADEGWYEVSVAGGHPTHRRPARLRSRPSCRPLLRRFEIANH